jgi:hypothetical protein
MMNGLMRAKPLAECVGAIENSGHFHTDCFTHRNSARLNTSCLLAQLVGLSNSCLPNLASSALVPLRTPLHTWHGPRNEHRMYLQMVGSRTSARGPPCVEKPWRLRSCDFFTAAARSWASACSSATAACGGRNPTTWTVPPWLGLPLLDRG